MKFKKPFLLISFIFGLTVCACSGANRSLRMQPAKKEEKVSSNDDLTIKAVAFESMGDCTLIQIGNCDVLIDCGGNHKNLTDSEGHKKVYEFLNENMKDDTIDYVIITHQDMDHTNAFISEGENQSGLPGWLFGKKGRKIGTLIDFDSTQDSTTYARFGSANPAIGKLYSATGYSYQIVRDLLPKDNYLTASQCCYKKRQQLENLSDEEVKMIESKVGMTNKTIKKPTNKFTLSTSENGSKATLKILYNKYNSCCDKEVSDNNRSIIVNQMSVCSLIEYGDDKFLFTGDLQEFDSKAGSRIYGETDLINNNYEDLKDGVMFYRGGHHGSKSSSSSYFCSVIRPQYVYWTGVAGKTPSEESSHPHQIAINNVGRYTDKIYYSMCGGNYHSNDNYADTLYGSVTFTYSPDKKPGEKMKVDYNAYDGKKKEPDSFFLSSFVKNNKNMEIPVYVYNLTDNTHVYKMIDCSYVKIGHIDILIGAGQNLYNGIDQTSRKTIVSKIKKLCNDKVLDYLIIPTNNVNSTGFLIDEKGKNGLLADDELAIKHFIHGKYREEDKTEILEEAVNERLIDKSGNITIEKGEKIPVYLDGVETNNSDVFIQFLNNNYSGASSIDDRSLMTMVSAFGFKYLNLGQNASYSQSILDNNRDILTSKIDAIQLAKYGYLESSSDDFYNFIKNISSTAYNHELQDKKESKKDKDKNVEEDKSALVNNYGMTALVNTTFAIDKSTKELSYPSKYLFLKTDDLPAFSYYSLTNNTEKRLCLFPTLKNVGEKTEPFNNSEDNVVINGDLCLRAFIWTNPSASKTRLGVSYNYGKEKDQLIFNNCLGDGNMVAENTYCGARMVTVNDSGML